MNTPNPFGRSIVPFFTTLRRRTLLLGLFAAALVVPTGMMALPPVTTNSAGVLILTNHFGDLNDDSQLDALDLVWLTHHFNGTRLLSPPMLTRAEVNQDAAVNDTDRRIIADMIAGRNTKAEEDFDSDELSNAEEIRLGTNPFGPDTDHDGSLDGWEVVEGTDPFNPQSRIPMMIVAQPRIQIIHPLLQNSDTNLLGTLVATPPLQVIHPLLQESDTNSLGTVLARPPVTIMNTNNPPP